MCQQPSYYCYWPPCLHSWVQYHWVLMNAKSGGWDLGKHVLTAKRFSSVLWVFQKVAQLDLGRTSLYCRGVAINQQLVVCLESWTRNGLIDKHLSIDVWQRRGARYHHRRERHYSITALTLRGVIAMVKPYVCETRPKLTPSLLWYEGNNQLWTLFCAYDRYYELI